MGSLLLCHARERGAICSLLGLTAQLPYRLTSADVNGRREAKAIQILGDLRASESTPTLVQSLILRTTSASMAQLILASLGKIGDARAVQPVIELVQRDLDAATRGVAVFALGEIGAPEAAGVLQRIAQTDEDQAARRVATDAERKIEAHHTVIRVVLEVNELGNTTRGPR